MRVKKYRAPTEQEAFKQIRAELGPEAIILQSQKVRAAGLRGWFGPPLLEVVAAIDVESAGGSRVPTAGLPVSSPRRAAPKAPLQSPDTALVYSPWTMRRPVAEPISGSAQQGNLPGAAKDRSSASPVADRAAFDQELSDLHEIVDRMRTIVDRMTVGSRDPQQIDPADGWIPTSAGVPHGEARLALGDARMTIGDGGIFRQDSRIPQLIDLVPSLGRMYRILLTQGIEEALALDLLGAAADAAGSQGMEQEQEVISALKLEFGRRLQTTGPLQQDGSDPKVVFLIGPTGVGKTTTIAKLAAGLALVDKRRVALATADTFRISGAQQLQTYAEIIGIPVEVVYSPAELRAWQTQHSDVAFLLVDTPGLSQHNHTQLAELAAFLSVIPRRTVYLAVAAGTKDADLIDITHNFAVVPIDGLLFTKLDETTQLGTILSGALAAQLPLTYFTTGQNVPDDIELAGIEGLMHRMLGRTAPAVPVQTG